MVLGFLGCSGRVGVARVKRRGMRRQSSFSMQTEGASKYFLTGTCANRVTWHASISVLLLAASVRSEFGSWDVAPGVRVRVWRFRDYEGRYSRVFAQSLSPRGEKARDSGQGC